MLKKIFLLIFKVSFALIFAISVYYSYLFYGVKKVEFNLQVNNFVKQVLGTEKTSNSAPVSKSQTQSQAPQTTTATPSASTSTKDTKTIQAKTGSSITSVNLVEHAEVNAKPIFGIPNAKQGDSFKVDGPLWYDGNAKLSKYDSKSMQMDISMKAADKVLGYDLNLPFKLKDGKLNLSISLDKKSEGKYTLVILDKNNNNSKQVQEVSETEKIIGSKKELTFSGAQGVTTFTISSAGDIAIKPHGVPFTLDLNKN